MKAALPVLALATTALLAACAPASKAPPLATAGTPALRAPVASGPARPAALSASPTTDWMDAPLTPGAWVYQNFGEGMGKRALFSDPDDSFYFALACAAGPDGMLVQFDRTGSPTKRFMAMTIRTETAQRTLTAERFGAQMIVAGVPASDPLLDAMALSKGRFAVEVEGEVPLILPSHAEVSRLVEDCR